MDGCFPSELRHRFPDGVPFQVPSCSFLSPAETHRGLMVGGGFFVQVHDRRHETFVHRLPWETFPGEGQRVCEERDESTNPVSFQLPGLFCSSSQSTEEIELEFIVLSFPDTQDRGGPWISF